MASTVWKGYLTFGLLSLPVKLYSAARSETVSFNQLHKDDHSRVKFRQAPAHQLLRAPAFRLGLSLRDLFHKR